MYTRFKILFILLAALAVSCTHSSVVHKETASPDMMPPKMTAPFDPGTRESYLKKKGALLSDDALFRFDDDITLNKEERKIDALLSDLRDQMNARYARRRFIPPANSFFKAKADLESSELINILTKMPKGGLLNIHANGAGDMEWIVDDALKRSNCYVYWYSDGEEFVEGELGVYNKGDEPAGFSRITDVEASEPFFSQLLAGQLILDDEDLSESDILHEFEKCSQKVQKYITYYPVFKNYFKGALERIINDNVSYIELRLGALELYDLDGKSYGANDVVDILWQLRNELKEKYPDFDLKLIISNMDAKNAEDDLAGIKAAMELRKKYPDFIIGYDITSDAGLDYLDNRLQISALEEAYGVSLPLYFNNQAGSKSDKFNLYDAYLLKVERIGHVLDLGHFPSLERAIIKEDIALEINPIGDQALDLVRDLRTHPAGGYLKRGVQCVIGSDAPGFYDYPGVSFDYWEAYMAWDLDLKAIKKLAMNSITYSGMNTSEKRDAMETFHKRWHEFIKWALNEYVDKDSVLPIPYNEMKFTDPSGPQEPY